MTSLKAEWEPKKKNLNSKTEINVLASPSNQRKKKGWKRFLQAKGIWCLAEYGNLGKNDVTVIKIVNMWVSKNAYYFHKITIWEIWNRNKIYKMKNTKAGGLEWN